MYNSFTYLFLVFPGVVRPERRREQVVVVVGSKDQRRKLLLMAISALAESGAAVHT